MVISFHNFQAILDELQQLEISLQQLNIATRNVVLELNDDHRHVIEHSVSNLMIRMQDLQAETQKQQSEILRTQTEWNDCQVLLSNYMIN